MKVEGPPSVITKLFNDRLGNKVQLTLTEDRTAVGVVVAATAVRNFVALRDEESGEYEHYKFEEIVSVTPALR